MRRLLIKVTTVCLVLAFAVPAAAKPDMQNGLWASGYSSHNHIRLDPTLLAKADEVQYPTIVLPGISQSDSFLADENGDPVLRENGKPLRGGLLIIDPDRTVQSALKNLLLPLLLTLATQNSIGIKKGAYKTLCDMFWVQATDKDGTPKNNLITETFDGPISTMPDAQKNIFYNETPIKSFADLVGEDNLYFFAYPLVGDPMQAGAKLHEFIQMVKAQRGTDKVNLLTLSLGGTVLSAYLDLKNEPYNGIASDYNDINRIINGVSALNGSEIMSDFFSRNFLLDNAFIYRDYFPALMEGETGSPLMGYLVNIAIRLLPRRAFEHLLTGAVDGVLETFMLYNPQFWALVPSQDYEMLAERYFSAPEFAEIRAKTDRFQRARNALPNNLVTLKTDFGVNTQTVCGYNQVFSDGAYKYFGIMKSTLTTNSDGIIHLASTSMGATYGSANTPLSDTYLAGRDPAYISPDRIVDASTCLFPNNTWFWTDQHHEAASNDAALELMVYLILGAITSNADEPDRFPRFNYGRNTKAMTRNYIPEAEAVLNDKAAYPQATPEQFDALEHALINAVAIMDETNIYAVGSHEPTQTQLLESLYALGVRERPVVDPARPYYTAAGKFLSDAVFRLWGPRGFSDLFYPYYYR